MHATDDSPIRRRLRLALAVGLQCLPLLGLGGCSALWTAVPVQTFLRQSTPPAFWAFWGTAVALALLSLCWGLGYLFLGRRERLGCALVLLGPLFVLWSYGYLFDGFLLARSDADELLRRRAMLGTIALTAGPVLLMAWDAWRLGQGPAEERRSRGAEEQRSRGAEERGSGLHPDRTDHRPLSPPGAKMMPTTDDRPPPTDH